MSGRSTHWAELAELGNGAGLRFLYATYRVLGRAPLCLMLYPLVCWYMLSNRLARDASLEYLQRLHATFGVLSRKPDWRMSLMHFMSFAETILDKFVAASGCFDFASVQLQGRQLLLDGVQQGQGMLLLTAHVGNLELCRALSDMRNPAPLKILVHTRHAEKFNRMLARLNPEHNIQLIQVTDISVATIAELSECVARGEIIVIAADRVPVSAQPRVTQANFLGKAAPFPVGPYVLASLLKCPVYLLLSARTAKGYRVSVEAFREQIVLPRGQRDAIMAGLAQEFADRLAVHCAAAPYEWFNFYPFWSQPVSRPRAHAKPEHHENA